MLVGLSGRVSYARLATCVITFIVVIIIYYSDDDDEGS